ncbi:MAG TPA: cellulase N-terminal Ig-like domain-containing protein [Bacteroidales bacterium]|nr:cellulase N-terminal Ig-like domain-containing protein [Bacteroidales bacterium]
MKKSFSSLIVLLITLASFSQKPSFILNDKEYFENGGVDVMAFQDIYPEGHQGGVAVIMHGMRIATNGDIRLNETPGQWQPIPKQKKRIVDVAGKSISVILTFPDSAINGKGFNPIFYPNLYFNYTVKTKAEGRSIHVTVDLDRPIPAEFIGKVGFNMELFPGLLFGKTWYMDNEPGIFPQQANGPAMYDKKGELVAAEPMATGNKLVVAPEDDKLRLSIQSANNTLQLIDGRYMHNNGWFVVRSLVPEGATSNAIEWIITPNIVEGWIGDPVIHVSQIGYHPSQPKYAFVELDRNDSKRENIQLVRITPEGQQQVIVSEKPSASASFLRYNYLKLDFSKIHDQGTYIIKYGLFDSQPFRIASDVFERHVWQPTLEYFLPVQMCHMQVNDKYRIWHGLCHMDDALMAPVSFNHFDGYLQGPSTLTKYKSGDHVQGLNIGGWHDAGDYDLRVESQSGEVYILTEIFEAFGVKYDETSIDQHTRIVEIHQPDGKPDLLQQIEHGSLSVVGGYRNLGRLYRGIISPGLRQYVLLGDGVNMTDGLIYDPKLSEGDKTATHSWKNDDDWVFTEDNPGRELSTAAHMAAAARVLKGFNDTLSGQCLDLSETIFHLNRPVTGRALSSKIHAASELLLTTGKDEYRKFIIDNEQALLKDIRGIGWLVVRSLPVINNNELTEKIRKEMAGLSADIIRQGAETPFGVPYRPNIWGAGWDIQSFGVRQYFLNKAFPDIFPADYVLNALNFILGVHPGSNTSSFASGVGSRSTTVAYGINRADWSYIPGGVSSGTALIRPDFPELLDWPFLWQQQEYVMGGGATNFMFLVLAAEELLN